MDHHLLWDENVQILRRLFMTATERHYRGLSDQIVSMSDRGVYGDTMDHLTFSAALEYKRPRILCDYEVVTLFVTRSEIAKLIKQRTHVSPTNGGVDTEPDAHTLAAALALGKAMQEFPIQHALSFCRDPHSLRIASRS